MVINEIYYNSQNCLHFFPILQYDIMLEFSITLLIHDFYYIVNLGLKRYARNKSYARNK
jgi:hypothetical protein